MCSVNRIPIYTKELALVFLPGHRNARTMRESDFSGNVAKGVWVPMGAIILTHILTSLNNLLFTCVEERFIQGRFNFYKGSLKISDLYGTYCIWFFCPH